MRGGFCPTPSAWLYAVVFLPQIAAHEQITNSPQR